MNGFIAIYNGKQVEIYADDLWEAKQQAIQKLKVPKSKQGLLSVMLAEKNGQPVVHSPASL